MTPQKLLKSGDQIDPSRLYEGTDAPITDRVKPRIYWNSEGVWMKRKIMLTGV